MQFFFSFYGNNFFTILFEGKVDWDLLYYNGPYFIGTEDLYSDNQSHNFNPVSDFP